MEELYGAGAAQRLEVDWRFGAVMVGGGVVALIDVIDWKSGGEMTVLDAAVAWTWLGVNVKEGEEALSSGIIAEVIRGGHVLWLGVDSVDVLVVPGGVEVVGVIVVGDAAEVVVVVLVVGSGVLRALVLRLNLFRWRIRSRDISVARWPGGDLGVVGVGEGLAAGAGLL